MSCFYSFCQAYEFIHTTFMYIAARALMPPPKKKKQATIYIDKWF